MIKGLGLQVENAWKNLRPMTKEMLVRVMKPQKQALRNKNYSYDPHADWEISRLLDALDLEAVASKVGQQPQKSLVEINDLAEACASVLESKTESAEIFIQLAKRALSRNDYNKIDRLSNVLMERFSASEIAEVIRQTEAPQVRAIAYETLAVMSTSSIKPLLKDPLYFEIACNVLEQQAVEFEKDEAALILEQLAVDFSIR